MAAAGEDAIAFGQSRALVREILIHAADHPWRMQADIGLLALRLDEHRAHRLHVWDPSLCDAAPPVHDHPYDFVSTVVAGELVNTRLHEDPEGREYRRVRYLASDEDVRRTDTVRLAAATTAYVPGARYAQLAHELHESRQEPGTVTILRCEWKEVTELTVCLRDHESFVSGRARPATLDEVKHITSKALALF